MKCLIVRPPFAEYIVENIKITEYRSRKTNIRGRIGIIESGTSSIIGDAELFGCSYNPDICLWEWKIEGARKYAIPIPIIRKKGTIVWQDIDYDYEKQAIIHFKRTIEKVAEQAMKCRKLEQEFIKKYVKKTYGLQK